VHSEPRPEPFPPSDDDRIVELMSLPTPYEAQAVADTLRGEGIVATVAPEEEHRVMVFASDIGRARELLDETSEHNAR
jgi:hypothetical protein